MKSRKKQYDDVLLEQLSDARRDLAGGHAGHAAIREHCQKEQDRTDREIVTQKLDDRETQFKRGYWAGLQFCLGAPLQVYDQRKAALDEEDQQERAGGSR